jgi:hypothetical protein
VGKPALYDLAHDIGLDHFTTQPTWGLTTITAGSQARFFSRIQDFIPKRHRSYAMHLLTRIIPEQRWGIPPVAPGHWKLYFKGGWSGAPSWRVNQVMLLRRPPRSFSLAILTREQPSYLYGQQSIQGVAHQLLDDFNRVGRPIRPREVARPKSGGIRTSWGRSPGSPRLDGSWPQRFSLVRPSARFP